VNLTYSKRLDRTFIWDTRIRAPCLMKNFSFPGLAPQSYAKLSIFDRLRKACSFFKALILSVYYLHVNSCKDWCLGSLFLFEMHWRFLPGLWGLISCFVIAIQIFQRRLSLLVVGSKTSRTLCNRAPPNLRTIFFVQIFVYHFTCNVKSQLHRVSC